MKCWGAAVLKYRQAQHSRKIKNYTMQNEISSNGSVLLRKPSECYMDRFVSIVSDKRLLVDFIMQNIVCSLSTLSSQCVFPFATSICMSTSYSRARVGHYRQECASLALALTLGFADGLYAKSPDVLLHATKASSASFKFEMRFFLGFSSKR